RPRRLARTRPQAVEHRLILRERLEQIEEHVGELARRREEKPVVAVADPLAEADAVVARADRHARSEESPDLRPDVAAGPRTGGGRLGGKRAGAGQRARSGTRRGGRPATRRSNSARRAPSPVTRITMFGTRRPAPAASQPRMRSSSSGTASITRSKSSSSVQL